MPRETDTCVNKRLQNRLSLRTLCDYQWLGAAASDMGTVRSLLPLARPLLGISRAPQEAVVTLKVMDSKGHERGRVQGTE